ncbi:meiotic recombination protein SPO11 [Nematocida homosporus]|uniref:meiotic recombination protein SPO11 n=1 Tax=Nematocida homosporus TaxID=1912981 RepID=UPI0022203A43|nr:meiotic recombination protein SPO11 [Nematocida homosporus]KAI5184588.1 meiotic recombination protein SPO11 [Nematocida homosporus]
MRWIKKEAAHIIKSKEAFMCMYPNYPMAAQVYDDIVFQTKSALDTPKKLQEAVYVLAVYYILLTEEGTVTPREIYYRGKSLFCTPRVIGRVLDRIAERLGVDLTYLNIAPSLKGLVYGKCVIKKPDSTQFLSGLSIIPRMDNVEYVATSANTVLVVEKEAIFNNIIQAVSLIETATGKELLVVTGKGYPCGNTLRLLMLLSSARVFGLFDCDPHGLNIYHVYKNGSKKRPHLRVPNLERIGVFINEIPATEELLPIQNGSPEHSLLRNISNFCDESLALDIKTMLNCQKKASIENVISSIPIPQYLIAKLKEHATFCTQ